ncbi:MAG: cyclic-di-AMP receptor [Oscillospiraceae bacterium]|jgi:uncharacterized protein YaaQ|nr:cyclic-di-AMP receptor [Oscillospiraceae bacterium]
MKLILSILNSDDASAVLRTLTKQGFAATKMATTGGFLMAGNVTILMGVDEDRVQQAIDIIKEQSHSRKQMVSTNSEVNGYYPRVPADVVVGGATIFVLDIEHFERA